ncbi:C40 family peptidase [Lentibacillus salicampi]|uniref:Peptidoglycan endopeptidase n=1 Tax=Lentibacillus salicampi TaxID=175306 RepID=A0A4Y9ADV7_9BACI|nr:C40 family peptidase [Lentibacillus salicampi]TFJ93287.1 peptidoglycan endopeptidase [Lentibacillus salicampi]
MVEHHHNVKKYAVSTALLTSLAFTPVLSGSVLAHGGPDAGTSQNKASVNVQVDKQKQAGPNVGLITTGDRGEEVKEVQAALNDHGHDLSTDGIFGAKTGGAVTDFQENNALQVDGIVGPETKEALFSATNDSDNVTIQEAPETKTDAETVSSDAQNEIISIAQSLVGTPYEYGGESPQTGFDSSGFINYVFAQAGIDLDRTHADMWANNGTHVDNPSPGDVVFFENTYQDGPSHSGIYIGDNQMIHAGTEETGVEVTTMTYDYWQSRYIGAKSFD